LNRHYNTSVWIYNYNVLVLFMITFSLISILLCATLKEDFVQVVKSTYIL
jgi:hypothetical protein